MKIYWLKLRDAYPYHGLGFGITARDRDDAVVLLARASCELGKSADASMIESWAEVESVADLDQRHVVPNMGMLLRRGVWFPNLPEIQ